MKTNIFLQCLFSLAACSSPKQDKLSESSPMNEKSQSLKSVLDEKKANFEAKADETKKAVYADGIQDIINKHVLDNALKVGDKAPNFELTNATGFSVSLDSKLKEGPVILMCYRGG
jgi:hypothetical protein